VKPNKPKGSDDYEYHLFESLVVIRYFRNIERRDYAYSK
jgi:hypothetical protein